MTTTTTCTVAGCDRSLEAKGLCHSHFEYLRRTGKMPTAPIPSRLPADRFWAKVDKTRSCWHWTGSTDGGGRYGSFYFEGKVRRAHRVVLVLAGRIPSVDLPPGRDVDHLCGVTLCVNPAHLEVVTHRTNVLRGKSLQAANSRKTHCPRGHPYDTILKSGGRWCSICNRNSTREAQRRRRARLRAERDQP